MIGYANYVDKQRKEDSEEHGSHPEPIHFDKGPGGLPLLPLEVKGVRGMEVAKHAQEIIRAYFLKHYHKLPESVLASTHCRFAPELATGCDSARTPWAVIGEDPNLFFDPSCLPPGFKFQDPSRMGVQIKTLLIHLRKRQEQLGVNGFHFHYILRNNILEAAEYPDEAKAALEGKEWPNLMNTEGTETPATDVQTLETPTRTPKRRTKKGVKSPRKKSTKGKVNPDEASVPQGSSEVQDTHIVKPANTVAQGIPSFNMPGPSSMQAWTGRQTCNNGQIPTTAASIPDNPFLAATTTQSISQPLPQFTAESGLPSFPLPLPPPPFFQYPFPYPQQYMAYLLQQQTDMADNKPPVRDGLPFAQVASDMACPNIDPHLLPPGQPVFSFPHFQSQPWPEQDSGVKEPENVSLVAPPIDTPRRKSTRTPKRKRSPSPVHAYTPSRSTRKRKPTVK